MRDDLQIVATVMSVDERVPPDVLAVTGASLATLLAKIPFYGPMAAVRVGLLGDDFILNPSYREIERSELDLVVAGTAEGVVMVEAGAQQLPEEDMIEAIDFGYEAVLELIRHQKETIAELGIEQVVPESPRKTPPFPTTWPSSAPKTSVRCSPSSRSPKPSATASLIRSRPRPPRRSLPSRTPMRCARL